MKHKIKVFVGVQTRAYEKGKISICEYDFRAANSEYETRAFLCEQEIEIEVPDFDLVGLEIEILEKKLDLEVKEAATRQANLRQQIQELKCLTHQQ